MHVLYHKSVYMYIYCKLIQSLIYLVDNFVSLLYIIINHPHITNLVTICILIEFSLNENANVLQY